MAKSTSYRGYVLWCVPTLCQVECIIYDGTIEKHRTSANFGKEARRKARLWIDDFENVVGAK